MVMGRRCYSKVFRIGLGDVGDWGILFWEGFVKESMPQTSWRCMRFKAHKMDGSENQEFLMS